MFPNNISFFVSVAVVLLIMEHSHNVDLSQIPLSALKENTHSILSSGLNHHKILPNKDGLPRDWRGIAHLIGLNGVETGWLGTKEDPFCALLSHWSKNGNLSLLQNYLEVIDRYDVLDDTKDLFCKSQSVTLIKLHFSHSIKGIKEILNDYIFSGK